MMPLLVDCINGKAERRQNEIKAFGFALVSDDKIYFVVGARLGLFDDQDLRAGISLASTCLSD